MMNFKRILFLFVTFLALNVTTNVKAITAPSYELATGGKIYANGTAITIDAPTVAVTNWTHYDTLQNVLNTRTNGGTEITNENATAIMSWEDNDTTYYVYILANNTSKIVGGSYQNDVTSTSITINGGTVKSIYAGGNGGTGETAVATSVGNATIIMNGGTVGVICGGGFYKNTITGKTTITINDGTVSGNIIAGSWNTNYDDSYIKETEINVNDGSAAVVFLNTAISGMTEETDHSKYVLDDVILNIAGGEIGTLVAKYASTVGNISINYEGGTVDEYFDRTYTDGEGTEDVFYGTATKITINMNSADANELATFEIKDTELPFDTQLKVTKITEGTNFTLVETSLQKEKTEKFTAYDISLFSNDLSIQPDGSLTIKLLIPEGYKKDLLRLYHVDAEGVKEEIEFEVEGDYIVFTTTHLSTYVVAEKKAVQNPDTSDKIMNYILLGSISIIGIVGYELFLNKKQKYN